MKRFAASLLILLLVLVFAGCTADKNNTAEPMSEAHSIEETTEKEELVPLLASDEENGIYLYGIKPRGVILYENGEGHYYDWEYSRSDYRAPKIFSGSFRFGSENDTAIVTYADNGKLDAEDLRIISYGFDEEDIYLINPDEYNSYAYSGVPYTYENETVTFSFDGKNYSFDISESFGSLNFDGVSYSECVSYEFENDSIYVNIVPCARSAGDDSDDLAKMDISIRARLQFDGYNISLADFSVKNTIGA